MIDIEIEIEPTFTTARGNVSEWIDHARQWEACWRRNEAFESHNESGVRATSGQRQLPESDLDEMDLTNRVSEIWVQMPNLSRMVARRRGRTSFAFDNLEIFNPREHLQCHLEGDRVVAAFTQPTSSSNREDLGAFCYANFSNEALALLQPKCFVHGWKPTAEARPIDHFGMPAYAVRMERVLPFSNPRMCGDQDNPNIFEHDEAVEFVIHREQGVILEWRALLDGEVYERHWFTSVAFAVPVDDTLFDRCSLPGDVTIER
ncbi:MAG: hypothetical protein H0T72_01405 [Chloroflexia bacterium]|nr:hypothetical protein [Chloroflexia bacterium]